MKDDILLSLLQSCTVAVQHDIQLINGLILVLRGVWHQGS